MTDKNQSLDEMKGAAVSFMDSLNVIERVLEKTVAQNIRIEKKLERIVKFQYGLVFLTTVSLLAFVSLLVMIVKTGNQMQSIQKEQATLVRGLGEIKTASTEAKEEATKARETAEKAPSVELSVDEDDGAVVVIRPQETAPKASAVVPLPLPKASFPSKSSSSKEEAPSKKVPRAVRIPIDFAEAEALDE